MCTARWAGTFQSGRRSGQAAIEFAILYSAVILPLTFGIVYVGEMYWVWHSAAEFTREGARYATTHCWQADGETLTLTVDVDPEGDWRLPLPRLGLRMSVPADLGRVRPVRTVVARVVRRITGYQNVYPAALVFKRHWLKYAQQAQWVFVAGNVGDIFIKFEPEP